MEVLKWMGIVAAVWVAVSIVLAIMWHRAAQRRPRVVFNSEPEVRHHDLRGRY